MEQNINKLMSEAIIACGYQEIPVAMEWMKSFVSKDDTKRVNYYLRKGTIQIQDKRKKFDKGVVVRDTKPDTIGKYL